MSINYHPAYRKPNSEHLAMDVTMRMSLLSPTIQSISVKDTLPKSPKAKLEAQGVD